MPPSVPPPGGVNDASTGGATTRLPLIRETTTMSPKVFSKSSSSGGPAMKPTTTQRSTASPSPATRKPDGRLPRNDLLRNNKNGKKKIHLLRKKRPGRRTSSPSPRRRTITKAENDREDIDTMDSSLNPVSAATTPPLDATGLAAYDGMNAVSPFNGGAASMMSPSPYMGMGMGMGGMGMGMGMGMNTMGGPYLSGLNQIVFNTQNIIFSISQAIHVVGANQQALHQAWESLNQMLDNALVTFHEMRALESTEQERETEEERKKRKRLKALRFAFVFGGGWLTYKLIRNLFFRKRTQLQNNPMLYGRDHYGQSNLDNRPMTYPGASTMSNYSSPGNFYGDTSMGHPGYSSNYYGTGNGYY